MTKFQQKLVDAVISCAIMQRVKQATRYDPDKESSLIVFTRNHYKGDVTILHYMSPKTKSEIAILAFDSLFVVNENVPAQIRQDILEENTQETHIFCIFSRSDSRSRIPDLNGMGAFRSLYIQVTASHIFRT